MESGGHHLIDFKRSPALFSSPEKKILAHLCLLMGAHMLENPFPTPAIE